MKRTKINTLTLAHIGTTLLLKGWAKTVRNQKDFSFIELNDGSTLSGIQVVADANLNGYEALIEQLTTGVSIQVTGTLVKSPPGHKQRFELHAKDLKVIGSCDPATYPLQKKRHSFEFLRTISHLRPRTNTQGAVLRVRNALAFATHQFFQQRGFLYIHTPILTASDCEGAGEQFLVTTLDIQKPPKLPDQSIDFSKDFFSKPAYLTVSGQLDAEALACALSDVYTFGPTWPLQISLTIKNAQNPTFSLLSNTC
jgi:asparaginyl-tRNA synthetase